MLVGFFAVPASRRPCLFFFSRGRPVGGLVCFFFRGAGRRAGLFVFFFAGPARPGGLFVFFSRPVAWARPGLGTYEYPWRPILPTFSKGMCHSWGPRLAGGRLGDVAALAGWGSVCFLFGGPSRPEALFVFFSRGRPAGGLVCFFFAGPAGRRACLFFISPRAQKSNNACWIFRRQIKNKQDLK